MTKLVVCAVFDRAVQAFNRPIFVPHQNVAIRSFTDEVNRVSDENQLARHPEDFELHAVAIYDEESGEFGPLEGGKRVLCRAQDVVRSKE